MFYLLPISVPCVKVTTDVLTRNGKDIAFGDYSATWRFHRKIVHAALCMFGEGSASIEKISKYSTLIYYLFTWEVESVFYVTTFSTVMFYKP